MWNEKSALVQQAEAVARKCSVKEVFLKILQNSQENTCAIFSFLIKLQASVTFDIWQCLLYVSGWKPFNESK